MINEELITLSLPFYNGTKRTVRVYIPNHKENEKMPVIYMTDGQNLFENGNPGQLGCWYTREAIREEQKISGKEAVIVGIHNDAGPVQRTNEMLPKSLGRLLLPDEMPDEAKKLIKQEGELFDDFIINTVMPAVNEQFPIKTDRNSTAFCGSSSGGLQAFFTSISHPDLFCISGVFSPAFPAYNIDDIFHFTSERIKENMPYLYFYSGAADPLESDICRATEKIYDSLAEVYPHEKLSKVILPDQPHHENAWAPIFKDFLHKFLLYKN